MGIDYEQEKVSRAREIENEMFKLKREQNACDESLFKLNYVKTQMSNLQCELKGMLEYTMKQEQFGKIVVSDIFEGVGANAVKAKFHASVEKMYCYGVELTQTIHAIELQTKKLRRHIDKLDEEITRLKRSL